MPVAEPGGGTPGFTPTPVPTTAPGPAPGSSPIPTSSSDYVQAAALANTAYQQALAQINSNRQSALQQFGYTGTIDPTTGTLTNMQVDPNNPYGEFQQMLSTHAQDQRQAESAAMQRGLGAATGPRGGGLAAQGLTADHLAFGADSANLGEQLTNTLAGLQSQQTDAQDTMNNALYQAELEATAAAIQNQAFDPADFSSIDTSGSGGGDPSGPADFHPISTATPKQVAKIAKTDPLIANAIRNSNSFVRAARTPPRKPKRGK